MASFKLSARSLKALEGVHKDLVAVVKRAIQITLMDFVVTEGLRSRERQAHLVKSGASKTMNSRHLTGHAVDLVAWKNGTISYAPADMKLLSLAMKQAAEELKIAMDWGGDWKSFVDTPHYELRRKVYK